MHRIVIGLFPVAILAFLGACSDSTPPKTVEPPPPQPAHDAGDTPLTTEASPEEQPPLPAETPDPVLAAAIEDINTRWAQVKTLRARLEMSSTMMAGPVRGGKITGQGVYEYEKSGEIGLYRAEISMRFENAAVDKEPPDSPAPAAKPTPPSVPAMKLLQVYDGQYVYLQNTFSISAPGIAAGQMPQNVIRGTPEEMGSFQMPGSTGPNPLARYQSEGWTIRLLPEAVVEERPAYEIEATPPDTANGILARGAQHLSFDKESGVLVKLVQFTAPDQPAATTLFKDLEFNAVIDPAHFVFELPDGAIMRDASEILAMFKGAGVPLPGGPPPMMPPTMMAPPPPPNPAP